MPMPTFLVIGAAKSGTTALYSYLAQHPDVYLPSAQEPSWFSFADQALEFTAPDGLAPAVNESTVTQRSAYEALFADASPGRARGDVSPVYLYWPGTAERLAAEVPDARVVAVLRHPVDRAYSAFMHARREGREPLHDFRAALQAEPQRIANNCGFMWRYRDLSRYAPQLLRWLDVFPRDQILLATYDEFAADPEALCRRVQAFIGVDEGFAPYTGVRYNASGLPRSRTLYNLLSSNSPIVRAVSRVTPLVGSEGIKRLQTRLRRQLLKRVPLAPDLRAELVHEWSPDIEELIELVDLDVDHWLRPMSNRAV